ncbi:MAG TPA: histidine kinase, partial [Bacteroidota bacterium]|nr:histidine kinase [Bacteroidota bacterium]
ATHENRFYPDFAGVARSYNFYPLSPQKSTDGIVSAALGLGKTVVEGGNTVRFCPRYPSDLIQFYSVEESLNSSQRNFFALQLDARSDFEIETHDVLVKPFDLSVAEADGTLQYVGSAYSAEDDSITDGLSRNGPRVVTFGPILRHRMFQLPQILELLLDMGTWGMGTPVEIEFAGTISVRRGAPREFALLQMRPLVVHREPEELNVEEFDRSQLICESKQVLGNGIIEDIRDIVLVDYEHFDRSQTREVAREVNLMNSRLVAENRPYLLIGVGRWGSLDPWLGIPVTWEHIAGARAIVETGFKELSVTPSQGSHFFQNITAFMVGYFTVNPHLEQGFVDWDWLLQQPAVETMHLTRLIRFPKPLVIKINGHQNKGVILKPETNREQAQ